MIDRNAIISIEFISNSIALMKERLFQSDVYLSAILHHTLSNWCGPLLEMVGNSLDLLLWAVNRSFQPIVAIVALLGLFKLSTSLWLFQLIFDDSPLYELLLGSALAFLIEIALKKLVQRQRPATASGKLFHVHELEVFSFPSGHSIRAGMAMILLWNHSLMPRYRSAKK